MPQRNRPAPHIHLHSIDPQNVDAVDGHGRERLVEFDDVDVVLQTEVEFPEEFWDGEGGAYAHYSGRDAGDGGAAEFAEDGLVHFEGGGAFHEEDGGG